MSLINRMDGFGPVAWLALLVLSFIVFWPLGLALLGFLLWSGRMGCWQEGRMGDWRDRMAERMAA